MNTLILELKQRIIEALNLDDLKPEDIDENAPLFGGNDDNVDGLELDSIDALELIIILDKNYGIKLKDAKEARPIFYSIATLAKYISENRK